MKIKRVDGKAPGASENTAFTIGFKMPVIPIDANALMEKRRMMTEEKGAYCVMCDAIPAHLVDDIPTLSLNTLRDEIYQDAVEHGLWEVYDAEVKRVLSGDPDFTDTFGGEKAIIHAWASNYVFREAEELENAAGSDSCFTEELADVIIMSMSVAGKLGIDIDAAIRRKMEINKNRPWKHGKND